MNQNIISSLKEVNLSPNDYIVLSDEQTRQENILWVRDSLNKLTKLGLIESGTLTLQGSKLLTLIETSSKELREEFNRFWEEYPKTDEWAHYPKTRLVRSSKTKTEASYYKAREQHSGDLIFKGLVDYIQFLKDTSTQKNNLKFMLSPYKFLEEKEYLNDYGVSFNQINLL